jgi:hypothetical protein
MVHDAVAPATYFCLPPLMSRDVVDWGLTLLTDDGRLSAFLLTLRSLARSRAALHVKVFGNGVTAQHYSFEERPIIHLTASAHVGK